MAPARDTPVSSNRLVLPNPHHGEAAEIMKSHHSVLLILELQLAGTGALDCLRTHLLHLPLMSRKKKKNFCFTDISPEELRLEYLNFLTSNNLQSYLTSVQQLINQWRNRINELKSLNTSTKLALLSDTKDGANPTAPTFGFGSGQVGAFGSSGFPMNSSSSGSAQNFSFKTSPGFGTTPGSPSVFGSPPAFGAVPSGSSAVSASTPAFGLRKPDVTSVAAFSFKSSAASGFESPGFSGFPASVATGPVGAPAFGSSSAMSGFGSLSSQSHTVFSKQPNDIFGGSSVSTSLPGSNVIVTTQNALFTPRDQLTVEELEQYQSKKFTLGRIPLKPPPVELLSI
ncbi:nucleoporin NUP42 isoform X3 [Perognathus longimembris pacificus]|uniref:nucleoporin NUP42 isoform X3 n=1 Tax=Perognathus longimembris pacificus TaxID=214514 RepID=UPI00201922CF|nr:nucleoporin NUP42 isoform X3 [Perognathus longimembris pacificus]